MLILSPAKGGTHGRAALYKCAPANSAKEKVLTITRTKPSRILTNDSSLSLSEQAQLARSLLLSAPGRLQPAIVPLSSLPKTHTANQTDAWAHRVR